MKLVRFGARGQERPRIVDTLGRIRDLCGHVADVSPDTLSDVTLRALAALPLDALPLVPEGTRLGPCEKVDWEVALGVGMGRKSEPVFLRTGQSMRLGIDGLGEQPQRVVAATIAEAR